MHEVKLTGQHGNGIQIPEVAKMGDHSGNTVQV